MNKIMKCLGVLIVICLLSMLLLSVSAASGKPASSAGSYLLGDTDGDGDVTILDATLVQRIIAKMVTDNDGSYTMRGDVDGDGDLSSNDVTLLMRYNAKLKTYFSIGEKVTAPTEPATQAITEAPTNPETHAPTETVTEAPTEAVTEAPTEAVTEAPTEAPTQRPTAKPDPYELPPI